MMNEEKGFTLIELLIVLSLLSVIILVSVSISLDYIKKQQTKHFLELLQSDIFFVQNQTFATTNSASLMFRENNYVVLKTYNDRYGKIREYPPHISFNHYENNTITFSNEGYQKPITIRFKIDGKSHQLIFPFGKGRGYVD